jgi:hypothetical protein
MEHQAWQGVPLTFIDSWRQLFNAAPQQEAMHLSAPCPVCGQRTLHRYYSLEKVAPRELRGVLYQGPGSYWEWCSSCKSFEHMHGYVPDWWKVEPLPIDHAQLTAIPDVLDDAL